MNSLLSCVLALLVLYILLMAFGFHKVRQGYVGIYKYFGVLDSRLYEPGIHFMIPFYQQFIEMSTMIETDVVTNIPCGTSNGTMVYFNKVEVVNRLKKQCVYETVKNYTQNYQKFWITDKLHHEINQFCSKHSLQQIYIDIFDQLDQQLIFSLNKDLVKWAPGIQIISIRVTKPQIPVQMRKNFQEMEKKKVDFYIEIEKSKVITEEQMTIQKKAIIAAESKFEVKLIDLDKMVRLKQNQKKMAQIEAVMIYDKQKTKVDIQFLPAFQQAELLPALYTDKYLHFLSVDALLSNAQIVVGDRIPNFNLTGSVR